MGCHMDEGKYACSIGTTLFRFNEQDEVIIFLNTVFAYCDDRKELYDYFAASIVTTIIAMVEQQTEQEEKFRILRFAMILKSRYGHIYDSDQKKLNISIPDTL